MVTCIRRLLTAQFKLYLMFKVRSNSLVVRKWTLTPGFPDSKPVFYPSKVDQICNRHFCTVSDPPPFCWGTTFSPKFWKGGSIRKNMSAWGDLRNSCHGYLPGGLLCFLSTKDVFFKKNMAFWAQRAWLVLGKQPINV